MSTIIDTLVTDRTQANVERVREAGGIAVTEEQNGRAN